MSVIGAGSIEMETKEGYSRTLQHPGEGEAERQQRAERRRQAQADRHAANAGGWCSSTWAFFQAASMPVMLSMLLDYQKRRRQANGETDSKATIFERVIWVTNFFQAVVSGVGFIGVPVGFMIRFVQPSMQLTHAMLIGIALGVIAISVLGFLNRHQLTASFRDTFSDAPRDSTQ
eukprot:TRINITY_DN101037_c0_g1_i1.p2 TRINITY_DN101037_c0_g1~~TRINITY_DN101037_c0_g1_i1.p2  ORF type:complete len:175 (+),score=35.30 TRINITY_DN101037_c0_g1_i1:83-607(+)